VVSAKGSKGKRFRVSMDAMGGDFAPEEIVKGMNDSLEPIDETPLQTECGRIAIGEYYLDE